MAESNMLSRFLFYSVTK